MSRCLMATTFLLVQELLTKHRPLVAKFLADNYERFFGAYQNLLKSQNYVTRRQSVKVKKPRSNSMSVLQHMLFSYWAKCWCIEATLTLCRNTYQNANI